MLFLRFLPCINIAEVKWTLTESDPHHDDHHDHPDHGVTTEAAYQKELARSLNSKFDSNLKISKFIIPTP